MQSTHQIVHVNSIETSQLQTFDEQLNRTTGTKVTIHPEVKLFPCALRSWGTL